jgi:hypothetical protein
MAIRSLIFPTCKELARRLSSGAYEKASWPVRLAVRWHLMRCELCRLYARQVDLLGDACRRASAKDAAPSDLKAKLAERLRRDGKER